MIQTELEEAGFDPLSLKALFLSALHSSTGKLYKLVFQYTQYILYNLWFNNRRHSLKLLIICILKSGG